MDSCQAPLFMEFSSQEYWSELLCPPPVDLPIPGIKPVSLMSPALTGRFFTTSVTWEAPTVDQVPTFQISSTSPSIIAYIWSTLLSSFITFTDPCNCLGPNDPGLPLCLILS